MRCYNNGCIVCAGIGLCYIGCFHCNIIAFYSNNKDIPNNISKILPTCSALISCFSVAENVADDYKITSTLVIQLEANCFAKICSVIDITVKNSQDVFYILECLTKL
jgi:hypothetical protein